jgi:hypothetical protein
VKALAAGRRWTAVAVMLAWMPGAAALAQQRPLVTEDPETIGEGRILLEAGVDVMRDVSFPVSGLRGHLFAGPTMGVSVGIGKIAELQIDGGFYRRLRITERRDAPLSPTLDFEGDETSTFEDVTIGTKIRIVGEAPGRPAFGARFATKLPNVSNSTGLGYDTTDFFASLLMAKTVESFRVVGNAGVAIISDPTDGVRQDDLLTLGLSVARAVTAATEIVGEVNGRLNLAAADPPALGAENRGMMRFGGRYTHRTVRIDAALILGMTSRDPKFGFTTGFTWVFDAFQLP